MTPRELFGEEIDEMLKAYYLNPRNPQVPSGFGSGGFMEGVDVANNQDANKRNDANRPMTKEEIVQMIMDLKAEGKI